IDNNSSEVKNLLYSIQRLCTVDPPGQREMNICGILLNLAWCSDRNKAFIHDIIGNPFKPIFLDPAWLTLTVKALAEQIYNDRAFDRMPILADALEEAGCTVKEVLEHCRNGGEHVRGCWVVDKVLGKE